MKFTEEFVFWPIFLLIAGYFLYRIIRNKGLRGAMFGGIVSKTIGEIELAKKGMIRSKIKVHRIQSGGANKIGIEVVHKGHLSYHMTPITLSREEAVRLTELIGRAVTEM